MALVIRPYTPADRDALILLLKQNIPLYFHPAEETDFIAYLTYEREEYFVVENAGGIIGAGGINFFPQERAARLSWDVVHPGWQGKGVGTQLTHFRINHLQQNRAVKQLVVRTTQLVYRFYEKMGFVLYKTEKDFWAPGFDLYQLHLPVKF